MPNPCCIKDCTRAVRADRLCAAHFDRRRRQMPDWDTRPIRNYRQYKPYTIEASGYVYVYKPNHPNSNRSGSVAQHTLVMSEALGRPLLAHENVHHINGVRSDNRLENLELWSTSQPPGQRVEDKVAWARQILATYGVVSV